eukprot:scaffold647896_cov52-Prasinocladus_malaysianus.AAC.1
MITGTHRYRRDELAGHPKRGTIRVAISAACRQSLNSKGNPRKQLNNPAQRAPCISAVPR